MNKTRRNKIEKIKSILASEKETLDFIRTSIESLKKNIDDAQSKLETIKDEEEEAMNNMPESLQGTERYEKCENAVDDLSDAIDSLIEYSESLDSIIDGDLFNIDLDEILSNLEEAAE